MFLVFFKGMNIHQGGDCCSMWLILSERHIWRKNGKFRRSALFHYGSIRFRGIFGISQYLRVSINTLSCNPNFGVVKIFNLCSRERKH